jgi:glycerol-1-phosphatase
VRAAEGEGVLVLDGSDTADRDGLDGLRALCVAHWSRHPQQGAPVRVVAAGPRAGDALGRWGLAAGPSAD